MTDPLSLLRARAALEDVSERDPTPPSEPGRFAPYPAWMGVTLLVRGAQLTFAACCIWYMSALFHAMGQPRHRPSTPPMWLWLGTLVLGASERWDSRRYRTSPMGDTIGNLLASQQCPACGQNIFDHTPPSGYAPDTQAHAVFPSRICTNCGQDLASRTAS
jgi:hypothetical protein